jgi:two-component system, NtrC family, sensor kinase
LDSLHYKLKYAKEDTSKIIAMAKLAGYYSTIRFDSTVLYARQTIDLAEKSNYNYGKFLGLLSICNANNVVGNYSRALEIALQMLHLGEQLKNYRNSLATAHAFIGFVNREMGNYPEAITHLRQAIFLAKESGEPMPALWGSFSQFAVIYMKKNQMDSALWYAKKGVAICSEANGGSVSGLSLAILGNVYDSLGNHILAEKYYRQGIATDRKFNTLYWLARLYNNLAGMFKITNRPDSCLHYAKTSLQLCQEHEFGNYALDASSIIVQIYESGHKADSAYKYLRVMVALKDSLFNQQKSLQFLMLDFDEKQRQKEIETTEERYLNQVRTIGLLAALGVFLLIAFILYRNNRQKQMTNAVLKRQKEELQTTLNELKTTQTQLIHSEKMASLGELTAGIAHEIQNPLNFMNNFSEVNKELIEEMKQELVVGNIAEATTIANNVQQNEDKINHHGKRADAIVKGMLQHSRISTGQKEPVDLNALTDEYLRLAYHGLRAKDKTFNASVKADFDKSIGKINMISQDIGRVLLNLYNNAFYALIEKKKQYGDGFEPFISVETKKANGKVEIRVKDNGNGIPQKVLDKIFQPFFTTKPAGQGTGLGLSLSYDIVKAHGGEIKVETKEGEFTEFVIQIPAV